MTPQQIDGMTFAAFHAMIGGYVKANSSESTETDLTEAEYLRVLVEEKALGRA